MTRVAVLAAALLSAVGAGGCVVLNPPTQLGIDPARVIDLSYAFGPDTVYWPTGESFELKPTAHGRTAAGYFYSANQICMAEHGGTHMDAPLHFAEGKRSAAQVPLSSCIGPAAVVDIREHAQANRDYQLSVDDLRRWEQRYGRLPANAVVVMNSGWGRFWPDKRNYLGTDKAGDVAGLRFPGFSRAAAEFLVRERDIAAIAVDTPSIDYGRSQDFVVHQVINGANKPAFENVANVDRLPPLGATFVALPMKIEHGSGGPARIIAILP